jgi:hypothetical protein
MIKLNKIQILFYEKGGTILTEIRARKVEKGDIFRLYSGYLKHLNLGNAKSLKLGSTLSVAQKMGSNHKLNMVIRKVEYKNKWYHRIAKLVGIKFLEYIEVVSLSE